MPVTTEPVSKIATSDAPAGEMPVIAGAEPGARQGHSPFARRNVLFESAKSAFGSAATWGGGALVIFHLHENIASKQLLRLRPSHVTLNKAAGWGAMSAFLSGLASSSEARIDNHRIDILNRHLGDPVAQRQIADAGRNHDPGPVEKLAFNASFASVLLAIVPPERRQTQLFRLGEFAGLGAFATALVTFTGRNLVAPYKEKNELKQLDKLLAHDAATPRSPRGIG